MTTPTMILSRSPTSVPYICILSTRLPRLWKASPVLASPPSYLPISDAANERLRDIPVSPRLDALVAGIVNGISVERTRKDI
ncbi:hypothetical protein F5141DRAFT_1133667 [Pisolithus sp. B1]|nr:hypothetical protein F5141DRAFT_1154482 [Pisolithus sp. B1]KAI6102911.1 hypothetical protein F5141DRAFT_1133667 [Pisolithus sp. B1]